MSSVGVVAAVSVDISGRCSSNSDQSTGEVSSSVRTMSKPKIQGATGPEYFIFGAVSPGWESDDVTVTLGHATPFPVSIRKIGNLARRTSRSVPQIGERKLLPLPERIDYQERWRGT